MKMNWLDDITLILIMKKYYDTKSVVCMPALFAVLDIGL